MAASGLGNAAEAAELLAAALHLLRAEDPAIVGRLESVALLHLVDALYELDREDEAAAVCREILVRFGRQQDQWAQDATGAARDWLADQVE